MKTNDRFHLVLVLILVGVILTGFSTAIQSKNKEIKYEELETTEDHYNKIIQYKDETTEGKIDALQSLEILHGDGVSLNLDKQLNRAEGAVIYFRLMGLDEKSKIFKKANPNYNTDFKDIPAWAKDNINYLYNQKLAQGITQHSFGASNIMTAEEFTTLILRGLGYSDLEGDFTWDKSLDKALDIGLISISEKIYIENNDIFTREKMAIITYNSLFQKHKIRETITLIDGINSIGYISRIFYTKLDQAEIVEINKALKNETYTIFKSSPEKTEKLYNKLYDMLVKINDIFNVEYNSENINIEVVKVTDIIISAKRDEIFIKFDTRNKDTNELIKSSAKAIMKNGIISIKTDEDYGKTSSIIWSILEKQYPNRVSQIVYLKNNPVNPWDQSSNSKYESWELDEADILDANKSSLGRIIIYSPRKSLNTHFTIKTSFAQ